MNLNLIEDELEIEFMQEQVVVEGYSEIFIAALTRPPMFSSLQTNWEASREQFDLELNAKFRKELQNQAGRYTGTSLSTSNK